MTAAASYNSMLTGGPIQGPRKQRAYGEEKD